MGNATESNFGIVEDLEDTKCDAEIIAKRVARQQVCVCVCVHPSAEVMNGADII